MSTISGPTARSTSLRQSLFQSLHLPTHNRHQDEEETIATDTITGDEKAATATTAEPKRERTRQAHKLVSGEDQLTLFRTLVGIDNPPGLHASTFFRSSRPAQNVGIYGRVIEAESKAHRSHRLFAFLISAALGAQILVAACLTALGAGNGPHKAVTAFGALNTVIAGFLAYLKGSGLPNRLKYYENNWTKVREYIEQRERDFCRENCVLDLEAEVLTIERMYEEVKGDIEANTPDSFISVRDISKRGGAINPAPAIAQVAGAVAGAATSKVIDGVSDPLNRSVAGLKRNLSYQGSQLEETVSGYGDKAAGYGKRAQSYQSAIAGYGNRAAEYGERARDFVQRPHSVGVTIGSGSQAPATVEKNDDLQP